MLLFTNRTNVYSNYFILNYYIFYCILNKHQVFFKLYDFKELILNFVFQKSCSYKLIKHT